MEHFEIQTARAGHFEYSLNDLRERDDYRRNKSVTIMNIGSRINAL